jgi:predicted nucleotidyltransferase
MQALSSYNPLENLHIQVALEGLEDPLNGLFRARPLFVSGRGTYVKFTWADWPEALSARLKETVESFLRQHPELRAIEKGSEDWRAVFLAETDGKAAAELGRRLDTHFPARVGWVVAERDNKGKIVANSFIDGVGEILWNLSWRRVSADPKVLKLDGQDVQSLNAAVFDVSKWASSRIQPILDALHNRLKALYGERFLGLYVFGSYARRDAGIDLGENSDLDVALILSDFDNLYDERGRFGDIVYDLSLEHGLVISVVPIREADFRGGQTNFTRVISQYAVPVK